MDVKIEFLQSIPYYSGLSPAELESIRRFTFETAAQKGEVVLLEGETSEKLYFVVSGVMKIFKTSANGKEQILQIVRPGESVNEVPIFDGVGEAGCPTRPPVGRAKLAAGSGLFSPLTDRPTDRRTPQSGRGDHPH